MIAGTRLECYDFEAFNELTKLQDMIKRYHECKGNYPERVEVKQKFSLTKRKCGIGLTVERINETACL